MIFGSLIILTLAMAVADWLAVAKRWRRLGYFTKPGVMVALLAAFTWGWLVVGRPAPLAWFAVGLVFSLAGDVCLMLPHERFIPGLLTFLLAHGCYIAGFNPTLPVFTPLSLLLAVGVGGLGWLIYRRMAAGRAVTMIGKLKPLVWLYITVISLMFLSALLTLTRPEWTIGTSALVIAGAALFLASDTMLAWNRFVAPISNGRLWVRLTYHLGQMGIVLGVVGSV